MRRKFKFVNWNYHFSKKSTSGHSSKCLVTPGTLNTFMNNNWPHVDKLLIQNVFIVVLAIDEDTVRWLDSRKVKISCHNTLHSVCIKYVGTYDGNHMSIVVVSYNLTIHVWGYAQFCWYNNFKLKLMWFWRRGKVPAGDKDKRLEDGRLNRRHLT